MEGAGTTGNKRDIESRYHCGERKLNRIRGEGTLCDLREPLHSLGLGFLRCEAGRGMWARPSPGSDSHEMGTCHASP